MITRKKFHRELLQFIGQVQQSLTQISEDAHKGLPVDLNGFRLDAAAEHAAITLLAIVDAAENYHTFKTPERN